MTTPDQLRAVVDYLQQRVGLAGTDRRTITFDPPDPGRMVVDGLDEATVRRLLVSPWWQEMIDDILETPEFAGSSETPEKLLGYARDVVQEYIGKRFPLNS